MSIRYNLFGQIEPANVYLCKPKQGISYALNGIDRNSFSYTTALQDIDSITFTVDRYIDVDGEQIESNGYNDLDYLMEVSIDNIGTFIIDTPPTVTKDTDKEVKEVSAKSCEWEMLSKDLVAFKVNTGEDTSVERLIDNNIDFTGLTIEYVCVYDKDRPQFSLLDIVIKEKLSNWSVGYVSEDIAKKTPYFNIDSTNVYAFFTQDMSKYLQCIFTFDAVNRKINVYSAEEIGEDTGINISDRNLLKQLSIEPQTEEIYTRYKVFGNDELDIRQVNFGSDTIEDITYYLDTKYMSQELIDKYKSFTEYKELRREDYINKMKEYISTLETRNELVNRLPLDALNYDWDSFNEDELKEELGYFQGLVNVILQSLVGIGTEVTNFINAHKSNAEMLKYKSALHLYIHNIDNLIDSYINSPTEDTLTVIINNIATITTRVDLQRILDGNFSWFAAIDYSELQNSMYWWDYTSYTTSIIPNIDIALSNIGQTDNDKVDYNEDWKTNWDLYGTNELKAQIELFKNKMESVSEYAKPWNNLSDTEKQKYTGEEPYNGLHNEYLEAKKNHDDATIKYNALMEEVSDYDEDLEMMQEELSSIANDVSIKNESFGFTDNELKILGSFYIDAEYTNENFLVTEYTTSTEKVDIELELLNYAKEDIAKQSRPQYHFSCDIDNLFAIADYKIWHDSLSNGNFIWISLDDLNYEKVRIVSITRNPMLPNDSELEVEFSNMLIWNGQRSDLTDLFDNAMSSTSNEISRGSLSSSSSSTEVSNDLIRYILNSRPMAQSMEVINLQQEVINQKNFKVIADNITLSSKQIILDGDTTINPGFILKADNMDVNSIFAKTITATGTIKGGTIDGAKIIADNGKIADWTINTNSFYKKVKNIEVTINNQDETSAGYFTYTYAIQAPNGSDSISFLYISRQKQKDIVSDSTDIKDIEFVGDTEKVFGVDYKGNIAFKRAKVGEFSTENTGSSWDIFSNNISSTNYNKKNNYYHSVYMRNPTDNGYDNVFGLIRSSSKDFSTFDTVYSVDYDGNIITLGDVIIKSLDGTNNRVLYTDINGKLCASSITNVKLGYLSDVTSNIQAQLNNHTHNYLPLIGGNLSGTLTVLKTDTTAATIRVTNSVRSGSFQVSSDGMLGIWDGTNSGWTLYSNANGVVNIGTTTIANGVNIGRASTSSSDTCNVTINGYRIQLKTNTTVNGNLGVSTNLSIGGTSTFTGKVTINNTASISNASFGLLTLTRSGSTNGAAITFVNDNGTLGSICMKGAIDTGLFRNQANNTFYQIIDEGIENWTCSGKITSDTIGCSSISTTGNIAIGGNLGINGAFTSTVYFGTAKSYSITTTGTTVLGTLTTSTHKPNTNSTSDTTGATLGNSNYKWRYLYAYSSSIQTSDKNYKHTISYDMENLDGVFNALKPCTFYMVGGGRKHMGFIANEVEKAMNQNGMTTDDLSFVCKDPEYILKDETLPDEESNREYILDSDGNKKYIYGLKYTELHALEVWQIQKLKTKVKELEEEIMLLKSNK